MSFEYNIYFFKKLTAKSIIGEINYNLKKNAFLLKLITFATPKNKP